MSDDWNISCDEIDALLKLMDKEIGHKIYSLRRSQGISQKQLADVIGVSSQQMNKYEKASNRVTASRMPLIAKALSKDISYFYSDIESQTLESKSTNRRNRSLILARTFRKIKNEKTQVAIINLVTALVENQE